MVVRRLPLYLSNNISDARGVHYDAADPAAKELVFDKAVKQLLGHI